MQLATIMVTIVACSLGTVEARKIPGELSDSHHSTKKELKDPRRFPRKSQVSDSTDFEPSLAYALPPVGYGQGLYGLGQGFDTSALASLVASGLQEGRQLSQPKRPVYHATPLEPYGALLNHAKPIEEPKQEEVITQAVHAQAHNFVDSSKYYSHDHHEDEYKDYAAKYQFGYRVRDLHTGNDFGQTESRDGHMTQGHYHVLLPDGRLQNVQYWSDDSGFHAKVTYDGHSQHY